MNFHFLRRGLVPLAGLMILAIGCSSPTSSKTSTSSGTGTGTTADTAQIGFETGYSIANVTANDADTASPMGMTFSLVTSPVHAGTGSLWIQGTAEQNAYSTDYFAEAAIALPSPVDFTGKTISAWVQVPTGSDVAAVNVTLKDATGDQVLLQENEITTQGSWVQVQFPNTPISYSSATPAVYSGITSLTFHFETRNSSATPVSAPVSIWLDSINW